MKQDICRWAMSVYVRQIGEHNNFTLIGMPQLDVPIAWTNVRSSGSEKIAGTSFGNFER
jgi:hypothetical protein